MLYIASPHGGMNESPSFLTWLLKIKKNKPYQKKKQTKQKIIDIIHPQMRLKKKRAVSLNDTFCRQVLCLLCGNSNELFGEWVAVYNSYIQLILFITLSWIIIINKNSSNNKIKQSVKGYDYVSWTDNSVWVEKRMKMQ